MDVNRVKNTTIFHGMSEKEISDALEGLKAVTRKYKKGTTILHAGSTTRRMGLVMEGGVTIGALNRNILRPEAWTAKIMSNLLTISTHKNLSLSGRSFHTAPKTIRGRVMSYLNSVSIQKGSTKFDIPFDRQQMADYLNLERTALSKERRKMKDNGLIEFHKNHFHLKELLEL